MSLSVERDLVFGGVDEVSGSGESAVTSTEVVVGSVVGGGVVMVGGRTGLVVEWLTVAGGVLDGGVVVAEGIVGVVRGGGLRLRLFLGLDLRDFA